MTLRLTVTFETFQNFPCFSILFNLMKLWYPPKRVPFALFNYFTFSYFILALLSAVTDIQTNL